MAWFRKYREGKRLFIDNFDMIPWKPIYGAPVGGIGCGTIGRGFRGEFCRFQMIPGMYKYNIIQADQFVVCVQRGGQTVYQQVLSPHQAKGRGLSAWKWGFPGDKAWYHALYPRSWTVYELPGQDITLICRQISPIFPHDYKDTSLPVGVFVWTVENHGSEPVEVSIMFTFQNGQGDPDPQRKTRVWSEPFQYQKNPKVSGVMIHQEFEQMPCTYAIAAKHSKTVSVSSKLAFNPNSPAYEIWEDLSIGGHLSYNGDSKVEAVNGEDLACAVCAKCCVRPGKSGKIEFSLSWDMPIIHFGSKATQYFRRYTKFFGTEGDASPKLAHYALSNYYSWEERIDDWQNPNLESSCLPAWYKSALFNELYFISDGGSVWLDPLVDDRNGFRKKPNSNHIPSLIKNYGKFAYLEGHEYRMYNTYDVHHYASFALLMLWPKLQLSIQYDIASLIPKEQSQLIKYCMTGEMAHLKAKNSVPHDIGDPDDDPWIRLNAYIIHPTQEWKDLNTKFILQVYRDYSYTSDEQYLKHMYPQVKAVIDHSLRWDTDNDGIIDNGGFPDQTYDAWSVTGASSYCGGMWLAAVKMFCEMASKLGYKKDLAKFSKVLECGIASFEKKLWNGKYYNYDSSESSYHTSIMADQLAGHWYLKAAGLPDDQIFPQDHVKSALKTIFECNVLPFGNGTMGAINGMQKNGKQDLTSIQSEEFWVGVNYALAATMVQEDMLEEAWQTAYGAYHTCWERYGLAFQTPEAYFANRQFRSLGYMRPLAIWAIQFALEKYHPELLV